MRPELEALALTADRDVVRASAIAALTVGAPLTAPRALGEPAEAPCLGARRRSEFAKTCSAVRRTEAAERPLGRGGCFVSRRMQHPTQPRIAFYRTCPDRPDQPWASRWTRQLGIRDERAGRTEWLEVELGPAVHSPSLLLGEFELELGAWSRDGRRFWFDRRATPESVGLRSHLFEYRGPGTLHSVSLGFELHLEPRPGDQDLVTVVTGDVRDDCPIVRFEDLATVQARCPTKNHRARSICIVRAPVTEIGVESLALRGSATIQCADKGDLVELKQLLRAEP